MYRDKLLTTFRNVNAKFDGLAELLENLEVLLKMLMRKELREDFLLSERLQSLDEVGGYNVKAMNRNVDLSPVNEMMPPLDIKTQDDEGEVPFKDGGAVGINPIIDISAESLGTEASPAGETYQSLEDSGAIVPIEQSAKAIVEDFEIDKKFKKAFETAMMLPSKAAAASLMDTMSKTPSKGDGTTIIKKNLSVMQSAFKLPTPEPTEDEQDDDPFPRDQAEEIAKAREKHEEEKEDPYEANKGKGLLELGLTWLMGKAQANEANAKAQGQMIPSVATGDPLVPDFYSAPGYMPGYVGDGEEKKGFWGRLKSAGKKAFDMTPMGMGVKMFGAAKDKMKNITENPKVKGFLGGVGNFAKKAFKYTPLGMAAGGIGSLINNFRGGDQTNLNELTENVLSESDARQQEILDNARNQVGEKPQMPMEGSPNAPGGGSMDQGSDEAIPKIKYSPYFDEYTVTSQF